MARSLNEAKGFSVIELMIVMVISTVVLASTFTLMGGTMRSASTNYELTTASQEFRISQEMLNRDFISLADGLVGVSAVWIPTDFATKYLTVRPASEIDPGSTGFVSATSTISDNDVPAGTTIDNNGTTENLLPGSDRVTIMTNDNTFAPVEVPWGSYSFSENKIWINPSRINDFKVGEFYCFVAGGTAIFAVVTSVNTGNNTVVFDAGDTFGINRLGVTGTVAIGTSYGMVPAVLKRIQMITYFLDDKNRLIRRVWGVNDKPFIENVVAEHVHSLQFKYTMDPGTTGVVLGAPIDQINIDQGNSLRMVTFSTSVESVNNITNGQKQHIEGSTTVGVRNVQFLEAPVPRDTTGNTALPYPQPTPYVTPTPTPTPVPTPTPPPTPVPTPTPIPTPPPPGTPTPTPIPTPIPTPPPPTPTPTPTPTPPPPTPTPGNGDN
ncbi:MAG: type II secretion system protein J [Pyrinomonadaceae bacterium]